MRRSLSQPSVRTEHTPIDLTHTPLDFPLSGAQLHISAGPHLPTPHATATHGHIPNQHRFCDCSSCSSIHRECGNESAASVTPVVVPFLRLDRYPFTISSSFTLAVRASPQMKPKQLHCACVFQGVAIRPVTATTLYLLTRLGIASLSRTLVSRSLGHSFTFSSASCPGDILSGGSLGLATANSATEIPTFCVNGSSVLRAPRSLSLVLLVHLASLLILTIVSGTFSGACIVRSATSSAQVSGYAPLLRT